ncbi:MULTISPECIES: hypothetical protein [unclassified Streptomyces]|uniref:hypothetical protein n=1 Tax=unclassified Streptomyces TaxID=2593676 RepID=UPI002E29E9A2|nr:hypothetical protein [Streptomyces sp. NBC_00228]WSW96388.1 hypothetical protein OG714_44190 [Streptomyces sp. NBC_00989]
MPRIRRNGPHAVWPWDQESGRGRTGSGGSAWLLPAATLAVLAGGYGWLGEVIAGMVGAVVGFLFGLVVSGLLYLLVERAVSGRPPSPPSRD